MKLGPQPRWEDNRHHCGYNITPGFPRERDCGQPCTLHLRLPDGEGFIGACADHERQARAIPHLDEHPWGTWCGLPGTVWIPPTDDTPSRCDLDGSGLDRVLAAATAAELAAV